jgi:hypothetical protein
MLYKVAANAVMLFHWLVVLFVLFAPISNNSAILILHITLCVCLIVHWMGNSNVCSLTLMEAQLRGLERSKTFTHQCISPIYDIGVSEWNTIIYIVTVMSLAISVYKLINNQNFKIFTACISKNKTFGENLKCLEILFAR